ncbi:MAG: sulfatase-like hydrolase/transferase, partial [Planctomycetales bacterium]|nr:sulfatase-like hydrolase/transferase [Planctomycetales bacterium]
MTNLRFACLAGASLIAGLLVRTSMVAATPVQNVVLILSDDHRYDFLGFHERAPRFLQTPNLDRMAREGAHLANAFVSTSLCSPSRASILTGRYMHHHRVVDNQRPVPDGTWFFPQHLQGQGFQTAFVGKWHMGHDHDEPRPGFNYWASFKGQGTYSDPTININGTRRTFEGYNADILTDIAVQWLNHERPAD